jgi:hypothetical protein
MRCSSANGTIETIHALDVQCNKQADRRQRTQRRSEERTQLKNPLTTTSTKRNKKGGQFMAVKKTAKKFKGVRREKAA